MERRSLSLKTTTDRESNGSLFLYVDDSRLQTGKRNDMAACLIQIVVHNLSSKEAADFQGGRGIAV